MSERGRRYGIIDEASTLIERLPRPPDPDDAPAELTPSSGLERSTEKKPAGRTGELTEAAPPTEDLPPAGSEDATLGLDSRTLIARRRPPAEIPKSTAEALHLATGALPSIAVPPHAERVLTGEAPISAFEEALRESTAPRIGEYALIARFPSSRAADVFLGYKVSNFGFIRRAVVKFVDRARYDYELVRQKLLDEARAISFVDHPNIVSVLDLAEDEVGTYVALEYVAGTDLRRLMVDLGHRNDRVPLEHALFIVLELLRGLAHVHAARGPRGEPLHIVHRDVNPSNILVSSDGHVKLTDFGAVLMDGRFQDATAPGTVKGKVRYLAPEYITEQTATSKVRGTPCSSRATRPRRCSASCRTACRCPRWTRSAPRRRCATSSPARRPAAPRSATRRPSIWSRRSKTS
ncbi:protein kinase [Myxococcota bacterium]|nr:protein kinase [Myxococcota bacterium]